MMHEGFLAVIGECSAFLGKTGGLPAALLMAGLVGGFTHCAGMCGPFVIAQTGYLHKAVSFMLLPYHAGRMTTYVALAVATNTVVNLAFAASPLKYLVAAPMLMLAGVIFIVTAFPRLGVLFPWALSMRMSLPYGWVSLASRKLLYHPGFFKKYLLGVLLGFMPCGLVVSALLASATAQNAGLAALAMAAFAVGTIPALMMTSWGGNILKNIFPNFSKYAFRGLMAVNGLWLIVLAGSLLR